MHIRLIAVSDRQPAWVRDAFDEYVKRLPGQWRFRLDTVATARRTGSSTPGQAVEAEAANVLRLVTPAEELVVLDERGAEWTSAELAGMLEDWQGGGSDVAFVIGGPDGVSADLKERARRLWSLSRLTLPHGLARVVLAEQLYRAWTLLTGHPYHRG
ncbi:MAG: 23S rRNA (pseudouridine(1915)-N(3))-methyltransferase RlmH [Woeseia sp.]